MHLTRGKTLRPTPEVAVREGVGHPINRANLDFSNEVWFLSVRPDWLI